MTKKTIKLNEAQLRNMIAEAINELDWKTVTNAANKSRGKVEDRVLQKGWEQFDTTGRYNPYGPSGSNIEYKRGGRRVNKDDETMRRIKQSDNLSKFADDAIAKKFGKQSYYNNLNGVGNEFPELGGNVDIDGNGFETFLRYDPNNDYAHDDDGFHYDLSELPQDFQDKAKEMNDFQTGKYKYKKGKGWQLKESQLRNMIVEAIKKMLKEQHENDNENEKRYVQR